MHDGCFGLIRRPFVSVPQVDDYFPGTGIENARTALVRCIQRGEGTGLVMGPSGTGKTMLCLTLAKQFQHSFRVAMLPSGRLSTRRALFQAILYELGRPYRGMDEGEVRLAVVDDLMVGDSSRGLLLLVDEAHVLPLSLLEELRLLTNLARDGQPLVRLVLAGGSILEERFASPKLDSFNQRLAARCYLSVFNRSETQEYIRHQITSVGGHAELLFPDDTCQTAFQATGGSPRLINQVCDHAMLLAYVAGRQQITPADIEEAWADLQQLPTPWSGGDTKNETTSGVIEFGSLDDSSDTSESSQASAMFSEDSAPTLRISANLDDAGADFGGPSQQIRRIEQLLAEADDDFQPAGSIVPEIELHFEELPHPFQEEFEHEEVITDRYATASRSATTERPVTMPHLTPNRVSAHALPEVPPIHEMPATRYDRDDASISSIAAYGGDATEFASGGDSEVEDASASAPAPVHVELPKDREAAVAQDAAILGEIRSEPPVRDDYMRPAAPRPEPMHAHEFRRLFARLRRG